MNTLLYQSLLRQLKIVLPATFTAVVLSNFSLSVPSSPSIPSSSTALSSASSLTSSSVSPSASPPSVLPAVSLGLAAQAQSSPRTSAQIAVQLDWSTLEQQIIAEHNRIRQNPQSYIPLLEAYLATIHEDGYIVHGCGQNCLLMTQEGQAAVEEAIAFLQQQQPVGPVSASPMVAQAARALAQDHRSGGDGHVGSDGTSFLQRLGQFGVEADRIGENISYGSTTAEEVILRLVVDDGVPGRKHRQNMFSSSWSNAGAGCGTHATYRSVCVINYASN